MNIDDSLSMENGVIEGDDGELYLGNGAHNPLDYMMGKISASDKSISSFESNLRYRMSISKKLGAKYIHVVAPDKPTVLRDQFPLLNFISLGEVVRARVDMPYLYPVEELKELHKHHRSYNQTDTHWSPEGNALVTRLVAQAYGIEAERLRELADDLQACITPNATDLIGDLGRKLDPPRSSKCSVFHPYWHTWTFANGIPKNQGNIYYVVSAHPKAQGRLLIFGDSFIIAMRYFLSAVFEEVVICRTQFLHKEIALGVKPDYILTENVERYLGVIQTDNNAQPFLMLPALLNRPTNYKPGAQAAIAAALSGGTPVHKKFLTKLKGLQPSSPKST